MWFKPDPLLNNKTDSLAIPATPAIPTTENIKTVSKIAGIAEIAEPFEYENAVIEIKPALIKCGDCINFQCFNAHGKGAGYCLVGAKDRIWSEREHDCESYHPKSETATKIAEIAEGKEKDPKIIITCYTPNGNPIKVSADSEAYADWLIKMNPKPKRKP